MKTTETIYRIVISLLIGLAGSRSAEAICFVNANATGANNGSSWNDAYTNPQFALLNHGCTEIWVAKGVYKPTAGTDQTISFEIPPGVTLYGGFAGMETDRDARSPSTNVTVFSADIDNNDRHVGDDQIDTSESDIVGNNSFHVVYLNGEAGVPITGSTVFDGFTITGGRANDPRDSENQRGAGLYCFAEHKNSVCSPTLRNLVFSGNLAVEEGGAIFNDGEDSGVSSPTLIDVTFSSNHALVAGGAIYDDGRNGTSSPILTNVFFNNNQSDAGGAIYNIGTDPDSDTIGSSSPTLSSVMFSHNTAMLGGAMYNFAANKGASKPLLYAVTFTGNSVRFGSPSSGGAVFDGSDGVGSECIPTFINVTFNENESDINGGAIANASSSAAQTEARLTNVTFSLNSAGVGGAVYDEATGGSTRSVLTNVILWGDRATDRANSEIFDASTQTKIDHSVVQNGCATGSVFTCTNILTGDPMLGALAENGGFTRTMLPAFGSSAIDTGLDSSCPGNDQRGLSRPQGPHCEIGAVEVVVAPVPPTAVRESIVMYRNTTKQITLVGFDNNPGGPYSLTYAQATPVSHGSVSLVNEIATYTPAHDYIGLDSFTYTVTDVNGTSLPATVSINVLATPEAQPFEFTIPLNTTKTITLAATDETPAGAFTYATVDLPTHGSVTLAGNLATYMPATDYSGPDSYTYTATDGNGTSPPATVTIHVLPAKVPPVALPRAIVVPYNTSGTITFGATDSNTGGPFVYSFAKASLTTHGTLGVVESTHVVYVPTHNYSGPDSFTYTVTDVNGTSVPATVTITVLPAGGTIPGGTSAVPAVNALGLMLLSGLVGVFGMVRRLR